MTRPKKALLIVAVAVTMVVMGFIVWSQQGNDSATIVNRSSNNAQQAPSFEKFNGKYMTFDYRSVYDSETLQAKDGDLEVTSLTAYNGFQKSLAIAVTDYTNGFDTNSAYKLRTAQTNVYERRDIQVQGKPALEFIRRDGTEVTVFVPNGKLLATLAFVSNGGQEDLMPEVNAVLASFSWK